MSGLCATLSNWFCYYICFDTKGWEIFRFFPHGGLFADATGINNWKRIYCPASSKQVHGIENFVLYPLKPNGVPIVLNVFVIPWYIKTFDSDMQRLTSYILYVKYLMVSSQIMKLFTILPTNYDCTILGIKNTQSHIHLIYMWYINRWNKQTCLLNLFFFGLGMKTQININKFPENSYFLYL